MRLAKNLAVYPQMKRLGQFFARVEGFARAPAPAGPRHHTDDWTVVWCRDG